MTDRFWRAAALLAVVVTGACYKATFVADPGSTKRATTHEEWTHHYVFGLVGEDTTYDVRRWCEGEAGVVRTGGNAGTVLATIFTLGIYAPRKVYVTCGEPALAQATEVAQ